MWLRRSTDGVVDVLHDRYEPVPSCDKEAVLLRLIDAAWVALLSEGVALALTEPDADRGTAVEVMLLDSLSLTVSEKECNAVVDLERDKEGLTLLEFVATRDGVARAGLSDSELLEVAL